MLNLVEDFSDKNNCIFYLGHLGPILFSWLFHFVAFSLTQFFYLSTNDSVIMTLMNFEMSQIRFPIFGDENFPYHWHWFDSFFLLRRLAAEKQIERFSKLNSTSSERDCWSLMWAPIVIRRLFLIFFASFKNDLIFPWMFNDNL